LVTVACFLPDWAEDLSAPRHTFRPFLLMLLVKWTLRSHWQCKSAPLSWP